MVAPAEARAVLVALQQLHPAPWNPRLIKDARFKMLCASISADPAFMWRRPILAMADGMIYAGNMRYRAALHLGWAEVPALIEDVSEQLAKERALRDNNQWGEWQDDDLAALVYELKEAGSDLDLTGFGPAEIRKLLACVSVGGEEAGRSLPPVPDIALSQGGELWLLGEHRLLCGNSTEPEHVRRLLRTERPQLMATDPPYNVGVDYGEGTDDKKSEALYETFTRSWFGLGQANSERQIITPGGSNLVSWLRWFDSYHVAPWIKTNAMTNGKVARWWCWEPILFFGDTWKRDRPNDVFDVPIRAQAETGDHPCPKPLDLIVNLLCNYSDPGDAIYEPFSGAGTTLIAAEQSGRRCYAMEIEPRYVDVAVKRWENLTGRTAVVEDRSA